MLNLYYNTAILNRTLADERVGSSILNQTISNKRVGSNYLFLNVTGNAIGNKLNAIEISFLTPCMLILLLLRDDFM